MKKQTIEKAVKSFMLKKHFEEKYEAKILELYPELKLKNGKVSKSKKAKKLVNDNFVRSGLYLYFNNYCRAYNMFLKNNF